MGDVNVQYSVMYLSLPYNKPLPHVYTFYDDVISFRFSKFSDCNFVLSTHQKRPSVHFGRKRELINLTKLILTK